MKPVSILLIDDDEKLAALLTPYLGRFGFDLHARAHPDTGLEALQKLSPAAVLLDLMLPGRDGFEVCKEIRKNSTVPILMLTARGEIADRVTGFELGADDYLPKPFEPRELVARLQAILRRSSSTAPSESFRIDRGARRVWLKEKELELTGGEYELLALLSSEPGKKWDWRTI
jgi:OmpR family response regulator RpaB